MTQEDADTFAEAGERIIRNLHRCGEIENAEVLFAEHKLMERVARTDDIDIKFKGFIDLVIRTKDKRGKTIVYIIDYKTCSWGWGAEKRRDEDLMTQLRLYKHFFSKKYGLDPKLVRTAFVLLKRYPPEKDPTDIAEWLPISAGPKTVKRAVVRLNRAITGMHSNEYTKNREECINKYGSRCPYYETDLCVED